MHLGRIKEVLERIDSHLVRGDSTTYARLLQLCSNAKAWPEGKQIHSRIIGAGLTQDVLLKNELLQMYLKCGSMVDAWPLFHSLPNQDAVTWTRMIAANAQLGKCTEVSKCFQRMQLDGVAPDKVAFVTLLSACASFGEEGLAQGKRIHACIAESQIEPNVVVGNALINMYGKCGSLETARMVFDRMQMTDTISWTSMISAYAQYDHCKEALLLLREMQQGGVPPSKITLITVLSAFANPEDLEEGRRIHAHMVARGFDSDLVAGNALLGMYGKCGSLKDALEAFAAMNQVDVISWNAVIAAYAQAGHHQEAFEMFQDMLLEGDAPNRTSFVTLLNACTYPADLAKGGRVHALLVESGLGSDVIVGNSLVSMYAKCGSLNEARNTFNAMDQRDLVSWNAVIAANAQHGCCSEALLRFRGMQLEGVVPNKVTFLTVLNACDDFLEGTKIHAQISTLEQDPVLGNALVNVYAKCGGLEVARKVFNGMQQRGLISWNTMIAAYAQQGQSKEAFQLFQRMQLEGTVPDRITFASIVSTCASLAESRLMHARITERGFESDIIVSNALLSMYGKWGDLEEARKMLHKMPQQDTISWNAIITAAAEYGRCKEALQLFKQMQLERVAPDKVTFMTILTVCDSPEFLAEGKLIHANIVESGFDSDVTLGNGLTNMYAKCGSLEDARKVFSEIRDKDLVSWNVLIAAYAESEHCKESLQCFRQMQLQGLRPTQVTLVTVLNACTSPDDLRQGELIHANIIESNLTSDVVVGNALANMYAKCGSLEDVERMFDKMHQRDLVSWNAMITCYAREGHLKDVFHCFQHMQSQGLKADSITFMNLLSACSQATALAESMMVHAYRVESGFGADVAMGNAIVGIHGRCGNLKNASEVFNSMPRRDAVSWNTIVAAYAQHGGGDEALGLFHEMQLDGFLPDHITFVSILSACSHSGEVGDGCGYFHSMIMDHGIVATIQHYGCIIDLLGRAGWLNEAEDFMQKMPVRPNDVMWMSLLSACKTHGSWEPAKRAARKVMDLNPEKAAGFIVLFNMYAGGEEAAYTLEAPHIQQHRLFMLN